MEPTTTDSVRAYDTSGRVLAYDTDMNVMHPLRSKMVSVALEVLPFDRQSELFAADLGIGTGFLTARFLDAFPNARVTGIDGAEAMVSFCKERLGDAAQRVEFVVADFQHLERGPIPDGSLDVVMSAFALHHLSAEEKTKLIAAALRWLKPGGWFLNADLVVAQNRDVENRIQQLRVDGVVARAAKGDARFESPAGTREFLDRLEQNEQDRPLPLLEDLAIARKAGLSSVEVFWKEYREAVWGGPKAGASALRRAPDCGLQA